jgi:hypothetical protein
VDGWGGAALWKSMSKADQEEVKRRLAELRTEHRDLDDAISALISTGGYNQVQIQRMKKRKLSLKDQILQAESALLPDIIA